MEISDLFLSNPTQLLSLQDFISLHPIKSHTHLLNVYLYDLTREIASIANLENSKAQQAQSVCSRLSQSNLEFGEKSCSLNVTHLDIVTPRLRLLSAGTTTKLDDVMRWEIVNRNMIYNSEKSNPVQVLPKTTLEEVGFVLNRTIAVLGGAEPLRLHNVYLRHNGITGREYVLDVELKEKAGGEGATEKRVSVLLPHLENLFQIEVTEFSPLEQAVEFVIPLSRVNQRLYDFLDMYEELCLKAMEQCHLNLVVYGEDDYKIIGRRLALLQDKYPGAVLRLVGGKGEFSRGRALNVGIAMLSPNDLVFICDVDMIIEKEFLRRCRRNTVRKKQVYYPEFFKYYKMEYVYRFTSKPWGKKISRQHGHWAAYSYGMLCMYKADYDATGGFDSSIEGWGGEDVEFAQRVLRKKFAIMRAPDPALSHRYHDKSCSTKLTPRQFADCISSRNEDLADRTRLAEYVFYLEERCQIKKWNLWG